jgi:hypothetical protein
VFKYVRDIGNATKIGHWIIKKEWYGHKKENKTGKNTKLWNARFEFIIYGNINVQIWIIHELK